MGLPREGVDNPLQGKDRGRKPSSKELRPLSTPRERKGSVSLKKYAFS